MLIILNGPTDWQCRHSQMGLQPSANNDVDNPEWAHQYVVLDDLIRLQADLKDRHQV